MSLSEGEREYLGADLELETVISRCLRVVRERGHSGHAEWTDARQTSTIARFCLTVTSERGAFYGHGKTMQLAAISCFKILWYHYVSVPSCPEPNAEELSLKASGKTRQALGNYRKRTGLGLGLGVSRSRLGIECSAKAMYRKRGNRITRRCPRSNLTAVFKWKINTRDPVIGTATSQRTGGSGNA